MTSETLRRAPPHPPIATIRAVLEVDDGIKLTSIRVHQCSNRQREVRSAGKEQKSSLLTTGAKEDGKASKTYANTMFTRVVT